jgi:protease I
MRIMTLLNTCRVAILATNGFEESELLVPLDALKQAGAEVEILSLKSGEIQGVVKDQNKGARVNVDHTIQDVSPDDFDAVHLPGGTVNADTLRMVPEVQTFLQKMQADNKPISAICHAPWELVSAGLVSGRTLTSHHSIQDDIKNAGGNWVDQALATDGNWITSRQPDDLPNFIPAMLTLFSTSQKQRQT